MFNALKYTEILEKVGFSREQAETSVKVLIEVMDDNFATKHDLKEFQSKIHLDMQEFKNEIKSEILTIKNEMKLLEQRMTIKLGTLMVVCMSLLTTLNKIL